MKREAMRNDVKAGYSAARLISNDQWARAQAVHLLVKAQADVAELDPEWRADRLAHGIEDALDYLLGVIQRPDPEPQETRLWHAAHNPGQPCPFHDGQLSFVGRVGKAAADV